MGGRLSSACVAFWGVGVTLLALGCEKPSDGTSSSAASKNTGGEKLKLGFIVKQPEEPWFQLEWKFADQAAAELGFELIKIGAPDGEKVLAAIDNLASLQAKGFVICTPDVRLGPGIVAAAKRHKLKMIAVDDQFVGADGGFMTDVHYLGISAGKIGRSVGESLLEQMNARGWPAEETAACVVTYEELDTARERTDGAAAALTEGGFNANRIFKAPVRTTDIPGAIDATNIVLTQNGDVKRWIVCGMNDNAVLGAVRAMETRGLAADAVIGIGINGTDCIDEFRKPTPTGFYASVLLTPRKHGYETVKMLYDWVIDGKEPPLDTRTTGIMINRENYEQVLKEQGITD